ncbi:hypothetical protein D3C71_1685570 [compost metagenome]
MAPAMRRPSLPASSPPRQDSQSARPATRKVICSSAAMNGELSETARRAGICQTQTAASSNIEATIGENHGQRAGKSKRVPERLMATSGATPATTPIWAIMWMVNEARSAKGSNNPQSATSRIKPV